MENSTDRETKIAELRAILNEATAPAINARHRQRMSNNRRFGDEVGMVHNALGAVVSLVVPWEGSGISPSGAPHCLEMVAREEFADLLEIIRDRLGAALDIEEERRHA